MEMPVLITKSPYFNFLREYWLACNKEDKPPQALVTEASMAWQDLEPSEKSLYEEVREGLLSYSSTTLLHPSHPSSLPI